jgi:glycosyltransferase involved in cell wall biosynthesis
VSTSSPLVSVIVPVYNSAKTLRLCLESVCAQTYRAHEVIVVDDASTDRSPTIARDFPCTLVEQPSNRGVSAARNAGVAASRGEILFFLDSDVALAPDAVNNAIRLLCEDPDCGCVYGVYAKEPLIDDGRVETYRTLHFHFMLTRGTGDTTTAIFALAAVPRRVFDAVGPFDENLRAAEDDDYSERLLVDYRIRLTDSVLGRHDEADRLLPLLAEQYRRAQLLPFAARNRLRKGALKVNRMSGVLTAALTMATLPLWLLWSWLVVLPAMFLALFAASDPPLSRFVVREKGVRFSIFFTAVHFLIHLAMLAGAATGWVRAVIDPSFGPSPSVAARRRSPDLSKGW